MAYNPQTQVNNSDGVPTSVGFNADSIYMPVQVQNGVTITSMPAIQTTPGVTITALQGTPLSPTIANAWPVNVVSSVPNLTISSMPNIAVTPGTTITNLASVTSGSPSYTPGTFQPLSLDTAGNLRVNVIQTVGGTSSGGVTPVQAATLGGVTITGMGVPGTPDNSSITVQGITNMVPVAVNTIPYQNQVTISGIGFTQGSFKIVPAVTNKRIKVSAYSVISSATTYTDVAFQDGGTRVWAIGVQAPPGTVTGANLAVEPPAFLFATSASNALHMSLSQPQGVTYSVLYWTDDAF